ncbi:MAG: hypothetical protein DRJ42_24010 [Deltaproteobacteria bacterium]|nr:MAG: hypothetical protein DRJ42_24010 [Deltaproteobacteria bacterium]
MGDTCQFTYMLNRGSRRLGVVLSPYLGRARARQRGATITQMLLDGRGDPLSIATTMLPELGEPTRIRAAAHVARAWQALGQN